MGALARDENDQSDDQSMPVAIETATVRKAAKSPTDNEEAPEVTLADLGAAAEKGGVVGLPIFAFLPLDTSENTKK